MELLFTENMEEKIRQQMPVYVNGHAHAHVHVHGKVNTTPVIEKVI